MKFKTAMLLASLALILAIASTALAAGSSHDESDLTDGNAHFYSAKIDGVTVKYFLIKTPDGAIHAAFDACDVCYPEKKGFRQEGNFMVCVNCGQRYPFARVGMFKGGCNPAPMVVTRDNGKINISEDALRIGVNFFK